MPNKNWNNSLYTRPRKTPTNYEVSRPGDLAEYIHAVELRAPYSDFDFNSASVGGRYLKYGLESYGY